MSKSVYIVKVSSPEIESETVAISGSLQLAHFSISQFLKELGFKGSYISNISLEDKGKTILAGDLTFTIKEKEGIK